MTSIDKMSIRGIRSFSPTETQVIEFYKPLTLIVGKNGSGKTTTIECLKMATTGDLPPNCRNGQAFINDPNVHNSSEVKAQIKLKFTTATGRPAVCTRSFSLVQKTTKKEYKAFEAALQTIDEKGDKTSLSYKCADLNKLVPEMMHVSTAVLDSVIFVHQEDACWPLQEDKVLKDRFDAIFAATNYTKALDAIKVYKADKAKDIKVLAAQLETLETLLNEANRLREELRSNEERKEMLEAAMAKCRAAAQEGKDRLPERRAVLDQFHRVRTEYQQAATEHNHASDAAGKALQELIRQYGGPLEESDAELQEIETSQGAATVQMRTDLDKTRNQIGEMERELESDEQRRDSARGLLEQQKAQEAHHKEVEREAVCAANELGRKYVSGSTASGAEVPPGVSPIQHVQAAADSLARVLHSRQSELTRAKEEQEQVRQTQRAKVQQQRLELEHGAEKANGKEREASSLLAKVRQLEERLEIGSQADLETRLARIRQENVELKADHRAAEEDVSGSSLREDLANHRNQKRTVRDKLSRLAEELVLISAEGEKQGRLHRQLQLAKEKREKLDASVSERRPKLHALMETCTADAEVLRLLEMESLGREFARKRATRDELVADREREAAAALDKAQKKGFEVQAKTEQLRELVRKIDEDEAAVRAQEPGMLAPSYDFPTQLAAVEEDVRKKEVDVQDCTGLLELMEQAKTKAESTGKCMVCSQKVDHALIQDRFVPLINKIKATPQNGAAQKAQLQEARDKVRRHQQLVELTQEIIKRKASEKPALEQMLEAARADHERLKREHEAKQQAAREARDLADKARDLKSDVDHLNHLFRDWTKEMTEVGTIQSGMQSGMGTLHRRRDVVEAEKEETESELERLERQIDKDDLALRQKEAELSELRTRRDQKENEVTKLSAECERRRDADARLTEVKQQMTQLQREAAELRESERPRQQQLAADENALRADELRLDAAVRNSDAKASECLRDQTRLAEYCTRLAQGSSSSRKQLLIDCEARVAETHRMVTEKREKVKERQHRAALLHEKLQGQEQLRTQMQANLIQREVAEKERALHEVIHESELERSRLEGSLSTIVAQITSTRMQLQDKKFKKIDQEHREKLIEFKTVQMAVDDLGRYYKALNAALMRFHETKMADVNKAITELWNKTYKGTDIDGITIKTENEGETADGRRKQTYRVVMKKGDTQLDMRGRCSAGQKVLASLVIRLALAESFCINCGILALDEPTTNLDRPNIESLAAALNEIIKARKHQTNFQLIVITHDEEFVQLIGRSENCSHYFYIEKKFGAAGTPPASTITKMSIDRFG